MLVGISHFMHSVSNYNFDLLLCNALILKFFRGGMELNNMTPASFTFTIGDRTVDTTYVENAANNRQPGLKNIHHKRRTVTHISKKSDKDTFYFYFHFYLDRCPPEMRNSSTLRLFQHPLRRADPSTDLVWYVLSQQF